jgi:K+-sensing histidine kinase KdpD
MSEADRHRVKLQAPVLELGEREVEIDEIMISAVFSNLIENAIVYNLPAGSIDCRAYESESGVTVEVHDSGKGLTKEQREGIFTAFDRAFAGILRKGVTIGLAFCRKVMQLHGGQIRAFSDGPGTGSTFVVTLPWAPEAAEEHSPRA